MTEHEALAHRAKGTAFEILYMERKPAPVDKKKERALENMKKHNKLRAERNKLAAMRDNKQYARWTI